MSPHVVWRWQKRSPRKRSGWESLTFAMSEETAADYAKREGVELRKVMKGAPNGGEAVAARRGDLEE